VLFEADSPADTFLAEINSYIRDQGNHGHGDDLLVLEMPATLHAVSVTVWPKAEVGAERHAALKADIELYIRAAFRESTASDYQPTLTHPQSRFSFSRLG